jgi:hypothetical protein
MPSVLCLGAGLVTAPGVKYMCQHGIEVTVASRTVSKAEEIVAGLANGKAVAVDVTQEVRRRCVGAWHVCAAMVYATCYPVEPTGRSMARLHRNLS